MKRRDFLRLAVGAGVCLKGPSPVSAAPDRTRTYPFRTLREAMDAAGLDPRAKESFTVVWAADVHYGPGAPEHILPPIFREVNAMQPLPAFFGIAGDLICKASLHFGQVPDEKQMQEAIAEFRLLKKHLRQCHPQIPVKLALGNHDTHPGEDAPALFHAVFPEHLEYHAFDVHGVPFIFLNGGCCGHIDRQQRAWFRDEVKKRHKQGGTLIVVCHQPALGSVTAERGIPA